jgi:hypothetical protein
MQWRTYDLTSRALSQMTPKYAASVLGSYEKAKQHQSQVQFSSCPQAFTISLLVLHHPRSSLLKVAYARTCMGAVGITRYFTITLPTDMCLNRSFIRGCHPSISYRTAQNSSEQDKQGAGNKSNTPPISAISTQPLASQHITSYHLGIHIELPPSTPIPTLAVPVLGSEEFRQ